METQETKPRTWHQHEIADVEKLQEYLDAKAPVMHRHQMPELEGVQEALSMKADRAYVDAQIAEIKAHSLPGQKPTQYRIIDAELDLTGMVIDLDGLDLTKPLLFQLDQNGVIITASMDGVNWSIYAHNISHTYKTDTVSTGMGGTPFVYEVSKPDTQFKSPLTVYAIPCDATRRVYMVEVDEGLSKLKLIPGSTKAIKLYAKLPLL